MKKLSPVFLIGIYALLELNEVEHSPFLIPFREAKILPFVASDSTTNGTYELSIMCNDPETLTFAYCDTVSLLGLDDLN